MPNHEGRVRSGPAFLFEEFELRDVVSTFIKAKVSKTLTTEIDAKPFSA